MITFHSMLLECTYVPYDYCLRCKHHSNAACNGAALAASDYKILIKRIVILYNNTNIETKKYEAHTHSGYVYVDDIAQHIFHS